MKGRKDSQPPSDDEADGSVKHLRGIGWLGFGSQVAVGALLLYWIVARNQVGFDQWGQRLVDFALLPVLLGCSCFALAMVVSAKRFRFFLPEGISLRYLLGLGLLQNALLTFLPWRVGEMGYPLLMRRDHQIPIQSSASVILAIRLMDLFIILAVAAIGAPQLLPIAREWLILGIPLGCTAGIGAWVLWRKGKNGGPSILSAVAFLRPSFRWMLLLGMSVAIFGATTLQSMFVLQAAGLAVKLSDMALLNALTLLAALLPIHPPGGWGTIDSVQVLILEWLGYAPHLATSSILAAHAFYTLLILAGGMAGWLLCRQRSSQR